MNEKEILDQIKKEPMEIPDSVKPESMREKLDTVTIKREKKNSVKSALADFTLVRKSWLTINYFFFG